MSDNEEGNNFFGEVPEELQELLQGLVSRAMLSNQPHRDQAVADGVKPSAEQFALGPGDLASVISTGSDDRQLTVIEILDPEPYGEDFPDWEERLYKSYVLGRWYDTDTVTGEVGWFPRVRLVKLEQSHFDYLLDLIRRDESITGIPPHWLVSRHAELVSGLNKANDNFMPEPVKCESCGGRAVFVETTTTERKIYAPGTFNIEEHDEASLYAYACYHTEESAEAVMVCMDCEREDDLKEQGREIYFRSPD
jgi:DNA-directed RNA polymerase subunit RPC12/RpoP